MAFFSKIDPEVLRHLELLAKKYSPHSPLALERLVKGWRLKEKIFMKQLKQHQMTLETELEADESRAFLLLSYSGSILGVGPSDAGGSRQLIYAGIGLRKDIPETLVEKCIKLKGPVKLDGEVEFTGGALKKSSPIYKIALMGETSSTEQLAQVDNVTRLITREFVTVNNRTILPQ